MSVRSAHAAMSSSSASSSASTVASRVAARSSSCGGSTSEASSRVRAASRPSTIAFRSTSRRPAASSTSRDPASSSTSQVLTTARQRSRRDADAVSSSATSKPTGRSAESACSRRSVEAKAWIVPIIAASTSRNAVTVTVSSGSPSTREASAERTRSRSSPAARSVKVIAAILRSGTPDTTVLTMRVTRVDVFPVPAPAATKAERSSCSAIASRSLWSSGMPGAITTPPRAQSRNQTRPRPLTSRRSARRHGHDVPSACTPGTSRGRHRAPRRTARRGPRRPDG